jgi:hypothetical protein
VSDNSKSKRQLQEELSLLRKRIAQLESKGFKGEKIHDSNNETTEIFSRAFKFALSGMGILSTKGVWQKVNPALYRIV